MQSGTVFNIQKFSINDGPGIRTTVFMKGCPLNCLWCHNPESKSAKPEIFFDKRKCTLCGSCVEVCPMGCHSITDTEHISDELSFADEAAVAEWIEKISAQTEVTVKKG